MPSTRFSSTGSKISAMPSRFVVQPTITPRNGSSHQMPKVWSTTATGMPSRKPKTKPKFTISLSSRSPTS